MFHVRSEEDRASPVGAGRVAEARTRTSMVMTGQEVSADPRVRWLPVYPISCADHSCRGRPPWEKSGIKEGLGGTRGSVIFTLLGPGGSLIRSQNPDIIGLGCTCALVDRPQLIFYFHLHSGAIYPAPSQVKWLP